MIYFIVKPKGKIVECKVKSTDSGVNSIRSKRKLLESRDLSPSAK